MCKIYITVVFRVLYVPTLFFCSGERSVKRSSLSLSLSSSIGAFPSTSFSHVLQINNRFIQPIHHGRHWSWWWVCITSTSKFCWTYFINIQRWLITNASSTTKILSIQTWDCNAHCCLTLLLDKYLTLLSFRSITKSHGTHALQWASDRWQWVQCVVFQSIHYELTCSASVDVAW